MSHFSKYYSSRRRNFTATNYHVLENEHFSEIANKTVHAALHFNRVPIGEMIWGVLYITFSIFFFIKKKIKIIKIIIVNVAFILF